MPVEYRCEGCGVQVTALGTFERPAHGFCVQCAFLCAYVSDPVEMMAMRKTLDAERREELVSSRAARSVALAGC